MQHGAQCIGKKLKIFLFSFAEKGLLANTSYDEVCGKIKNVFIENYRQKSSFFTNQQKFPVYYTQLWGGGSE